MAKYGQIDKHITSLTVSGEEVPEIDGDGDPVLAEEGASVAPDADIHGASSRLWCQSSEVDWVLSEVVHTPALSFISRKSVETLKSIQTWALNNKNPTEAMRIWAILTKLY